jgi:hypothetical protein
MGTYVAIEAPKEWRLNGVGIWLKKRDAKPQEELL